jgi:hypothetical protein
MSSSHVNSLTDTLHLTQTPRVQLTQTPQRPQTPRASSTVIRGALPESETQTRTILPERLATQTIHLFRPTTVAPTPPPTLLQKATVLSSVTSSTAASVVGSAISSGSTATDMQSLFVIGSFRCNNTFLKKMADDGDRAIIPLRIGDAPLNGLYGMALILGSAVFLHFLLSAMAFRLLRWESLLEGCRRTGFPSASIAMCSALHQGTFMEAFRIWSGAVAASTGEVAGSIFMFLIVIGPAFGNFLWPLIGLEEKFVPYRHVFNAFPLSLKVLVLPQGYWTTLQPVSPTMRSGFSGFVAKPFSLFGFVGMIRSVSAAAVAVLGKNQTCEVQTWSVAGTFIATSALALIFRPYCTRLTLSISTISSALTVSLIILNQYSGYDTTLEKLSLASSIVTFSGTVLLLILKVLTNRWRAAEDKAVAEASASGVGSDRAMAELVVGDGGTRDRTSTNFLGDDLLASALLVAPTTDDEEASLRERRPPPTKPLRQEKKKSTSVSLSGYNPLND